MPDEPTAELASDLRRGVLMTSRRLRAERVGDVTESQYSVLVQLAHAGSATPSELASRERVSAPSMTRTIGCLVDSGLVERLPHPDDGRQVLVNVTDKGTAVIRATRRRRDAWLTTHLRDLSPDELTTLSAAAAILRRISAE